MNKKKNSSITIIIYGVAIIVAICAGIMIGRAFDETMTDEGRMDAVSALGVIDKVNPQEAFNAALKEPKSYARKGAILGVVVVAVYYMYTATTKKRYHRKGVEHGSARWGNDEEKKTLQDSNDLYNNIIYADDVYLVLDRKEREKNK